MARFAPAALSKFHGAFDGHAMTGNDNLIGRVEISSRDDRALGCLGENALEFIFRQLEQSSHRADASRNSLLHILAALSHQTHGVDKSQRPGSDECCVFTEAVSCHNSGANSLLFQYAQSGYRDRQQRRLLVGGRLEILVDAIETER